MKSTSSSHLWLTAAAALALFGCSGSPDDPMGQEDDGAAASGSSGSGTSSGSNSSSSSSSSASGGGAGAGGSMPTPEHCENLVGEGDRVGDIAANWTLEDHLGNMVSLHDFCGKVLFFEEGSMW